MASDSAAHKTRTWRIGRAIAGILGLIFALVYLFEGRNLPVGQMRAPGAGIFPLVVGVIFALVSMGVIIDALWSKMPGKVTLPAGEDRKRLIIIFCAFLVYVGLINLLGFLISTVLLVIVFTRVVGEVSWLKAAMCGFGLTLLVWLAFAVLLGVRLPAGIWG
ncbi:tripartite tricarboxylate transporter TctB family protein [Aureimonas fodinaquatilis]|uniref:tripartite tricarboxylate transporter TctB family protein n=1 Tax=Aureimonas fodinaquatilis TaxID=2565783 RepID=UPI00165E6623|nr:tripartite tricarboxylate transporter TctB family protein [Aureimonas fodinaquatilis]